MIEWKSSRIRRIGMPNKNKILKYWQSKQDFNYELYENECFACGNVTLGVHRCHIIPAIHGGSNKEENLHLLCPSCHNESEGLAEYWTWFDFKRHNEWKSPVYWIHRRFKSIGIDLDEVAKTMCSNGYTYEEVQEHVQDLFNNIIRR